MESAPEEIEKEETDLSFVAEYTWDVPDEKVSAALRGLMGANMVETMRELMTGKPTASAALSEQETWRLRWLIAVNPNTPPAVLDSLVQHGSPALLERIAEHPRTNPSTLARLAFDPCPDVRAAVAENSRTPREAQFMLLDDEHLDVRYRLAESYHLPEEMLELLTEDENPYVAHRARMTLQRLHAGPAIRGRFEKNAQRRDRGFMENA